MTPLPHPPESFEGLCRMSATFGADPMHIQGAGGNSSIKDGEVMRIKASGTQLADAQTKEIFVPTDHAGIRRALDTNDPSADQPAEFLFPGGSGLRPSIETSLHAVFPHRVVLHTHCIHTLAFAIQQDARHLLAERLSAFAWAFVEYAKPGANLARSVSAALSADTNVIVLGNHGLIVAGDTVDAVEALQRRVHNSLLLDPDTSADPHLDHLSQLIAGTDYEVSDDPALHQLALDSGRVKQVTKGSLYPDHVIFCGIAVPALKQNETVDAAVERVMDRGAPAPVWMLVPGAGVIVHKDAGVPARIMMRCLADVVARVLPEAQLTYLSTDQNIELLNWDAEKYRQALNDS